MTALFVGLATLDIASSVPRYPVEDSKTQASEQFVGAGGPAANAAVAYTVTTGRPARLLTALGRHPLTELARHDLTGHHVTVIDATPDRDARPPVSTIVVAHETGSRTIVGLDAAGIHAPWSTDLAEHLDGAAVVLVDGHHPELALGIATRARQRGVPVVLDAGRYKPVHDELLPLVEVAICSSAFTPPGFTGDTDALLEHLHTAGARHVAVTAGPAPIRYATTGGRSGHIDVTPVPDADTLGAGDILHGAFCAYYPHGGEFVDALTRASAVSTLSCRSFGTRSWAAQFKASSR